MDDNNGELEELKIDRQRRAMLTRGDGGYSYERSGSNGTKERRFFDPLIIAAIIALVGAVWVLGINVAQLQTSSQYNRDDIKELRGDLKELQGKTFRGLEGYDDNWQGSQPKKDGANGNRGASGEKSADQRKP